MFIANSKEQNEVGDDYVKSSFIFNHNGNNIDIEIHSTSDYYLLTDVKIINSIIVDFENIFHYFVDSPKEQIEQFKIDDIENYESKVAYVHDNLIEFFYEEEYIIKDGIKSILEDES